MSEYTPLSDRYPPGPGTVAVAFAAGVAGLLGSFGAAGFAPGFVLAPVESTLSQVMPGALITFAITVLGDLGQKLNVALAGTLVAGLYALLVGLTIGIGRRLDERLVPVVGGPAAVWAATAALTLRPGLSLGAAVGAGVVVWLTDLSRSGERFVGRRDPDGRRRVVTALGTAAAASAVGYSLGRRSDSAASAGGDGGNLGGGGEGREGVPTGDPAIYGNVDVPTFDVDDQLAAADERTYDFGGMDPLVSEEFFNVSYSSVSPTPDAAEWSLSVTGEVGEELSYSYADLRERGFEHRFVTLRCVGEPLNGHKMDNALWSGVPIAPLVAAADPDSECDCVMVRAADDYYEEFPVEALETGMLALGMNGGPIPRGHGAPVRALIPGHWGEINVKWITEIEFLDREQDGYWEQKGWHGTGPVNTVAKLHATTRTEDDQILVGGHAYAGTRDVERVEVSVDGGETWVDADLTERLPGATGAVENPPEYANDAWRQWKYAYDPPSGSHEVVVRATDGTGERQPREERNAFPSGPSGWVSETIDPSRVQ
ncbi:molybdopterin-dependent oxidoreductase [Halosimplex amylolyticum]|uniref:molybdopterin-dependent oxidoreductase n=1 Tax=Halosimplex amylolyticum TaxID=3396616 RepID=UPI003F567CF7